MIITKTPFRMSFFGGGTDMKEFYEQYGGAVLSTTFDKYCYVTVRHLPRFFDYTSEFAYANIERVKDVEEIDGVTRCICSYHQERQRINAYFTGSIDKKELHRRLKVLLPAYMIPNRFHHVEEFRLNKNGKIDRKVLEELVEI